MKNKLERMRERLKTFGMKEWGMLLVVGLCLLILVIPTKETGKDERTGEKGEEVNVPTQVPVQGSSYTERMEQRVEELLSQVEHVGKVKVMLTVNSTEEKIVLKDGSQEKQETTETDSEGGSRVKIEESMDTETVFSGNVPYLLSESYPEVIGVVVLAEGSGTGSVDYDILNAVQVLFDIPAHKIKIMKMK